MTSLLSQPRSVKVSKSKPRPKPERRILFQSFPNGPRLGLVRISVGTEAADYWLSRLPSDFGGAAFRLEKFAPEGDEPASYDVLLADDQGHHSCECKGFLRWGRCKHVDGMSALCLSGRLSSAPPRVVDAVEEDGGLRLVAG